MRVLVVVLVGAAIIAGLAGCAADPRAGSPSVEASPTPEITIRMGPDGPELPEEAVAELQAYGRQHADEFGGLYVENQAHGSFVMLFTDHLDEHAAALAKIWPRVTVRGVRFSEAALVAVLESLDLAGMAREGVEPLSAGLDTMNNVVTLDLKSDDPSLEARLELEFGGMVDVSVHPLPGEWTNVTEGDGWRLVATGVGDGNEAYRVRAAIDEAEWEALWTALSLDGDRPEVALEDEVVVSFAHGIGSSCPEVRLDDVAIEGGVVFSVVSDPLEPRACTADLAGAAVFVVAIERAALPQEFFTVQLRRDSPVCGSCEDEQIDVDLP